MPCCGSFPELPLLARDHPDRAIIGIDLSPGMLAVARERMAGVPSAEVIEGDATNLRRQWPGQAAAVVSVFGLQQLPDPAYALRDWSAALRPGGRLAVVFWPDRVETTGPFALLDELLRSNRPDEPSGEPSLTDVLKASGATVQRRTDFPDDPPRCCHLLRRGDHRRTTPGPGRHPWRAVHR